MSGPCVSLGPFQMSGAEVGGSQMGGVGEQEGRGQGVGPIWELPPGKEILPGPWRQIFLNI